MNYSNSNYLLERARNLISGASQTWSKCYHMFPGNYPRFLKSGDGSEVVDVDGNKYIDFINALTSVSLGYLDPDVDAAVISQIRINGCNFSLPTELEIGLAELMAKHVPCAEMSRFAKGGSDVTTAAVRLARAYTGKKRILTYGYHGWHDWTVADDSARNNGVPVEYGYFVHQFGYNDIEDFERLLRMYAGEIAAVIMEPVCFVKPEGNFLADIRRLCNSHGIVLIFDEVITGFRFGMGGAQEYFGVVPDLATFGKAMGNGYSISALCGSRDIMSLLDKDACFSSTFGGECIGLAAAIATIKKMEKEGVHEHIWSIGDLIIERIGILIDEYDLGDHLKILGYSPWSLIVMNEELYDGFRERMAANGVLIYKTHNISYSHSLDDVEKLVNAYDSFFIDFPIEKENELRNNINKAAAWPRHGGMKNK